MIKKRKRRKDKMKREVRKKKMGEMVGDQIANQAFEPLKKEEKKKKEKMITSSGTVELQSVLVVLLFL
jgi:hypothetical protein